jgi:putative membrane protein
MAHFVESFLGRNHKSAKVVESRWTAIGGRLTLSEQTFLSDAAQGNKAEIQLAHLALKNSHNSKVRTFAIRMIHDHTALNQQLHRLAGRKNLALPNELSAEAQHEESKLKQLAGSQFDKAYADYEVAQHKKLLDRFQNEADSARGLAVREFAKSVIPILKEHAKLAEQLIHLKKQS